MATAERTTVEIGGKRLSLSNRDKVLWPRDGYTKGDLIDYYERVAPFIVPHLAQRPLTLERYPNGIEAPSFFEKRVPKGTPDWVDRVTVESPEGRHASITYVVCNDAASLIYLANLASIILHAWTSRVETLEEPDYVIFDLDPGEACTLKTLVTVALGFRDVLASVGLAPLVKTSGGYGLHLELPLVAGYTYETAKLFAELVARRVAGDLGKLVTLERTIAKRDAAAVYLDYVQVGHGKTMVAPYSVRARDRAPVSMPLDWSEVEAFARKRGTQNPLDTFAAFNIETAPKRLAQDGDRWAGRAWKKARLEPALAKAQKLWR